MDVTQVGNCPDAEANQTLVEVYVQGFIEAKISRHEYHRCKVTLFRTGFHCGMEHHTSGRFVQFSPFLPFINLKREFPKTSVSHSLLEF